MTMANDDGWRTKCEQCGQWCLSDVGELYCPSCGWSGIDRNCIGDRLEIGFNMLSGEYTDDC